MTEEQMKTLCKLVVENGNRPISNIEKELIKKAIDESSNYKELILALMCSLRMGK